MKNHLHTISMLVENEFGALARIAGLFAARGYNILELNVAPASFDESLSRLNLVTEGDENQIEQILKQLNKLIDVIKVVNLSEEKHVMREMLLVKVAAEKSSVRQEVYQLSEIFRSPIIDITPKTMVIQVVGNPKKNSAFMQAIGEDKIIEFSRTGRLGLFRGNNNLST